MDAACWWLCNCWTTGLKGAGVASRLVEFLWEALGWVCVNVFVCSCVHIAGEKKNPQVTLLLEPSVLWSCVQSMTRQVIITALCFWQLCRRGGFKQRKLSERKSAHLTQKKTGQSCQVECCQCFRDYCDDFVWPYLISTCIHVRENNFLCVLCNEWSWLSAV